MSLSGLSATREVSRGGYRAPDRRAPQEAPAEPPPAPTEPPAEPVPHDVAFFASRFRADLSQLKLPAQPHPDASETSEGDPALFDFFGNLSVLLVAVRSGDIARAQAAADALEMDVLVERSAGRRGGEPGHMLDDLGRLIGAAHSRDEAGARAAAKDLAVDVGDALSPPPPAPPPPDPYADSGAVYDTLSHYFDADARVV